MPPLQLPLCWSKVSQKYHSAHLRYCMASATLPWLHADIQLPGEVSLVLRAGREGKERVSEVGRMFLGGRKVEQRQMRPAMDWQRTPLPYPNLLPQPPDIGVVCLDFHQLYGVPCRLYF